MEADDALARALLIALSIPDERDLAILRRAAHESPDRPPERVGGIGIGLRQRMVALRDCDEVSEERRRCERLGFDLVPWSAAAPRYPEALFDLAAPPPVLWLRGSGPWPPPQPITIVGARSSTARGRAFARELGAGVVARGGAVVSGLAIGIDQAAHEGALEVDGPACAVLACGVGEIYPPGAIPLSERLERAGRIVSEMPLGTPPYKDHFPRRNRILAALSKATLVVEADLKSGSLLTANRALELGRGVFAVPGAIDAPTSRGTNRLVRDGAHPLLGVEDLDLLLSAPGRRSDGRGAVGDESETLLAALAAPVATDDLARNLGLPVDRLLLRLVELEADGRVTRLGGGLYVRA